MDWRSVGRFEVWLEVGLSGTRRQQSRTNPKQTVNQNTDYLVADMVRDLVVKLPQGLIQLAPGMSLISTCSCCNDTGGVTSPDYKGAEAALVVTWDSK